MTRDGAERENRNRSADALHFHFGPSLFWCAQVALGALRSGYSRMRSMDLRRPWRTEGFRPVGMVIISVCRAALFGDLLDYLFPLRLLSLDPLPERGR